MESIGTWWMWAGFFALVLVMLAIDLFLVGAQAASRLGQGSGDLVGNLGRCLHALCRCSLVVPRRGGRARGGQHQVTGSFITRYLIENRIAVATTSSLWLMLFSFFAIPPELQKRRADLGVLCAIVMRTFMILRRAWASSTQFIGSL